MENTQELNKLLVWLGNDLTLGARRYEEIRQRLIVLFRYRGCSAPEELADETIDRTAKALAKPEFVFEGNPIAYFRGVAKNVYLEFQRRESRFKREPIAEDLPPQQVDDSREERMLSCLDRCLGRMSDEKRMLLLDYYKGDKRLKIENRNRLAEQGGVNALRIQIYRLRKLVRGCVENCVQTNEM